MNLNQRQTPRHSPDCGEDVVLHAEAVPEDFQLARIHPTVFLSFVTVFVFQIL